MDIYLDFEATQFKENVLAIGASCINGRFDCLVAPPKGDKVTKFITNLTGITTEMADNALSIDEAFFDLWDWLISMTASTIGPTFFHVFGNMDKVFLQNAAKNCEDNTLRVFIENLADSLIDDSKKVCKYFHMKSIGVYRALQFFDKEAPAQDHDPLNDAIALHQLMLYISLAEPLEECPFEVAPKVQKPPKKFHVVATKKKEQPKFFRIPDEAYEWAYKEVLKTNPDATKKTVHKNLKRAFTNNSKYLGWKWHKEFVKEGK